MKTIINPDLAWFADLDKPTFVAKLNNLYALRSSLGDGSGRFLKFTTYPSVMYELKLNDAIHQWLNGTPYPLHSLWQGEDPIGFKLGFLFAVHVTDDILNYFTSITRSQMWFHTWANLGVMYCQQDKQRIMEEQLHPLMYPAILQTQKLLETREFVGGDGCFNDDHGKQLFNLRIAELCGAEIPDLYSMSYFDSDFEDFKAWEDRLTTHKDRWQMCRHNQFDMALPVSYMFERDWNAIILGDSDDDLMRSESSTKALQAYLDAYSMGETPNHIITFDQDWSYGECV